MVSGPKTAIRAADASSTQPGSVAGLMNTLLAKVRGSYTAKLMTVTACADLSARPRAV